VGRCAGTNGLATPLIRNVRRAREMGSEPFGNDGGGNEMLSFVEVEGSRASVGTESEPS
jgi:hypothetical protein